MQILIPFRHHMTFTVSSTVAFGQCGHGVSSIMEFNNNIWSESSPHSATAYSKANPDSKIALASCYLKNRSSCKFYKILTSQTNSLEKEADFEEHNLEMTFFASLTNICIFGISVCS